MVPVLTCPDARVLELLLLGRLPEADAEPLEAHLAECPECAVRVGQLRAADKVVEGLRTGRDAEMNHNQKLAAVIIPWLKRLRAKDATVPSTDLDTPPTGAKTEETLGFANFDFLAPAQGPQEMGGLGPYRVLKTLGAGGMGMVFLAEDPVLHRQLALKVIKPELLQRPEVRQRFFKEAQAVAALHHDNIVAIFHVGEDRGVPYLAMPFLHGQALEDRLQAPGPLPLDEILRIGGEIADGLAAAHAAGLVHRDIKPGNIWLEAPRGRVKILDFGLARAASQDSGLTQQGTIVGTPAYMAPEQCRGAAVDARCDLFSLGVILYRVCTGQQPFQGNDTVATLMAIAMTELDAPSKLNPRVPSELSELVMKLIEKDPAKRTASAGAVVQAIHALQKKIALRQLAEDTPAARHVITDRPRLDTLPTAPGLTASAFGRAITLRRRPRPVPILAVLVAAALGGLLLAAAGTIYYWQTNNGVVRIEINDPKIKVAIAGDEIKLDGADPKEIRLKPGEHGLSITRGDFTFDTTRFDLKRGDAITLRIEWFADGKVQVLRDGKRIAVKEPPAPAFPPLDPAWVKVVASMKPEDQVAAVKAELMRRNRGFDGTLKFELEDDDVIELQFLSDHVTDLTPVTALPRLRHLNCCGSEGDQRAPLADLSPLRGTKLTILNCGWTSVRDLAPLQGMKLAHLTVNHTQVADLTPLKGMPLTLLGLEVTPVKDLTPLQGMKLALLWCGATKVTDLTPIEGMPILHLTVFATEVSDLRPLRGMPLNNLHIGGTKVTDLTPLENLPLTILDLDDSKIADLSALKNLKLIELHCGNTPVRDLTPLKGMSLTYLDIDDSQVEDLTPIKDMKLTTFYCHGSKVTDLTVLKGMPLKLLNCNFAKERDAAILRAIPTLERINGQPPAELLK